MLIVNFLLLLYLNKLRHNEIIRKDYILDLFKKLNLSMKNDTNLNETSEISKVINKFFSFEEWLSENTDANLNEISEITKVINKFFRFEEWLSEKMDENT